MQSQLQSECSVEEECSHVTTDHSQDTGATLNVARGLLDIYPYTMCNLPASPLFA